MPEATTLGRPMQRTQPWPKLARCRCCGQEVMKARHQRQGRPVTLEPVPVLPLGPCGHCKATGQVWVKLDVEGRYGVGNSARVRGAAPNEIGAHAGATARHRVDCPVCDGTGRRGIRLDHPDVVLVDCEGIIRLERPHPRDAGFHTHGWIAGYVRHRCAA